MGALAAQQAQAPDKTVLRKEAEGAFAARDFEKAAELLAQLVEIEPKDASAWHRLGYSLHAQGKLDEALQAHLKAAEFPATKSLGTYNAACVYALKNDKDKAFELLGKAVDAGFSQTDTLDNDTDMDSLRDDPRFADIQKRVREGAKTAKAQPFVITTERKSSRVAFFGGATGSPGQMSITYGAPPWKAEYAKALDSDKLKNRRWRLGSDVWTTFDTNMDVEIAGVKVPANDYYCVSEWRGGDEFVLILLDPTEVRKAKLDAFVAERTTGGIEIPLQHQKTDDLADELEIKLGVEDTNSAGSLTIRFGPHTLSAPMKLPVS
jgi:tetratricopeptide (TPR) repeat protein